MYGQRTFFETGWIKQAALAPHGKEDLLDAFFGARAGRRFLPTVFLGSGRDDTHRSRELVGCLPQQLVQLNLSSSRAKRK